MRHCPKKNTPTGIGVSADGFVTATHFGCQQWDCPYCAKANQRMWRAFLGGQLPLVSDNWYHVTLTAHSKMREQQQSYENLAHGIDVILKRIRRVFGQVDYARVYEKHPSSEALHAHIAIAGLSPFIVPGCYKNHQPGYIAVTNRPAFEGFWTLRSWLKGTAHECHIGYQAEVRQAEAGNSAFYITKYLTKVSQSIHIKGLRHVSTSHRVGSPGNENNDLWEVGNVITAMEVDKYETIKDIQTGERISYATLQKMGTYPPTGTI